MFRLFVTLANGLEEEDGGADGDVERVEPAQHGNTDVGIGGLTPRIGQSGRLGTHDDGRATAHVGVVYCLVLAYFIFSYYYFLIHFEILPAFALQHAGMVYALAL